MSRLVAIWSPGGAGATRLTLALSLAASRLGTPTLAADFNLGQPDLALHLNLLREEDPLAPCLTNLLPDLTGRRLQPEALARAVRPVPKVPGLAVLPGLLRTLEGCRLQEDHLLQLLALLRRISPLTFLDTAPALDSVGTFTALQAADVAYLVVGASESSRFHLARQLPLLPDLGIATAKLNLVTIGGGRPGQLRRELGLETRTYLQPEFDPFNPAPCASLRSLLAHAMGSAPGGDSHASS